MSGKMRTALITLLSIMLTCAVVGNAYIQKRQFYPSVVYITKSNPSMAVLYIQAFVLVVLMGKVCRKLFFGTLRAAEVEHLIERSWYAVTETCLAFTVFRDDFNTKFVAMFTFLLFLKSFHWLGEDRVDYMERSPIITLLFHLRIIALISTLGCIDMYFVYTAYHSTLVKGASVQLVFGFEYAILYTAILTTLVKYILHCIDMYGENPWDDKAVYLLYTELILGFVKVFLYVSFTLIMIKVHTFPLFAIRPLYLSVRNFKKALSDVIMSRRAIHNMNTLYPDATPEELNRSTTDNVCIICREEMVTASKKLPCNHIFHTTCLRSWFQRQQTCPTCRMDVLRAPAPTAPPPQPAPAAAPQAAPTTPPQPQQPPAPGQPPAFVMPNLMYPPPPQPVPTTSTGFSPATPQTTVGFVPFPLGMQQDGTASIGATNVSSGMSVPPTFGGMPPMPFIPMPFTVPFPSSSVPPSLSDEEVRELEGLERRNVEARIACLRNIQLLLDAAVIQMNQYSSIISSSSSAGSGSAGSAASATRQDGGDDNDNDIHSDEDLSPVSSDEIRRRRLDKLSRGEAAMDNAA